MGASAESTTNRRRSRKVPSAQWMSSISTTSGRVGRQPLEQPPGRREGLLDRVRRLDQADRGADALREVGLAGDRLQLGHGELPRVVVRDAGGLPHDLGERPERDPVAVGEAAPVERAHVAAGAGEELAEQARLADAGRAEHRHELRPALPPGSLERVLQHGELVVPPDHRGVEPARDPLVAGDRHQAVGGDPVGLALQLERLHRHDLHGVANEPVRRVADQHLGDRRRLLQARGGVHRVAGDEPLTRGDVPGDDLAGVDAGSVLQANAPASLEPRVELDERVLHLERGADGAEGVVLVEHRETEHGHDRVADVLLHGPAVALEHGAHPVEVLAQDLAERLGVQRLAEARRALQVAEDDRDGLAHLLRDRVGHELACRRSRTGGSGRGSPPRTRGRSAWGGVYAGEGSAPEPVFAGRERD